VVHCVSSLDRNIHPMTGRAMLPVATYVAVTEPLQQSAIRTRSAISDSRRAGNYYRLVDEGRILRFRTCMTGEFYALLRRQSVLARMLPEVEPEPDAAAFARGVRVAAEEGSLLSSAFGTRALALFGQMAADALPSYLSGLVIGEELRAMRTSGWYANDASPILVGEPALTRRYAEAFALNGMTARQASAGASWRGLAAIARRLPSLAGCTAGAGRAVPSCAVWHPRAETAFSAQVGHSGTRRR
jgi:hypothetical protein